MLEQILKARDHQKLVNTANLIKNQMEVIQSQLDALADELSQVEG